MSAAVIIIGVGEYERYTLPLLQSLDEHEGENINNGSLKIVVVDNGSDNPYPQHPRTIMATVSDTVSYPAAINIGIAAAGVNDWYIPINNDTLFTRPFVGTISELDKYSLYGFATHHFGALSR